MKLNQTYVLYGPSDWYLLPTTDKGWSPVLKLKGNLWLFPNSNNTVSTHQSLLIAFLLLVQELTVADVRTLYRKNNRQIRDVMIFQIQNKLDIPETAQKKAWRSMFLTLKVHPDNFNKILSSEDTTFAAIDYFETLGHQQPKLREFVKALIGCGRYDLASIICNWPYENNEDTNYETQV